MNRPVVALGASAVVAVAVIAIVLVFGIIPLPTFASLQDSPDASITGTVAFLRGSGEDRCLWTVPASGGRAREVTCRIEGRAAGSIGQVAWTKDGELAVETWDEFGGSVLVLDARTGETLRQFRQATDKGLPVARAMQDRSKRADGAIVTGGSPRRRIATITVRTGGTSTEVLRADGPRDYGFRNVQWSPDGRWILAQDSADRLLVVPATPGRTRVLVEDAEQPSWFIPGNTTYTVDPDQQATG